MIKLNTRENGAVFFWFWNGDQQEAEITRQLELAAAGGLRGMAIHARSGNQTDYMSDRWIVLTRHSCEEALRLGLDIWLYDEEGFPSGTVGHKRIHQIAKITTGKLRFICLESLVETIELRSLAVY